MSHHTIETARLVLRRFAEQDGPAAFRFLSDERVMHFLPWFCAQDVDEATAFLDTHFLSWYRRADAGERGELGMPLDLRYAICPREGEHAGEPVGLVNISARTDAFDLGYALAPEAWHQGLASEAAGALVAAARAAGFPYLTATHDRENPRSGAVMARVGMTYRYTYLEQWQPKDIPVHFRLWQVDLAPGVPTYRAYWDRYPEHEVEAL